MLEGPNAEHKPILAEMGLEEEFWTPDSIQKYAANLKIVEIAQTANFDPKGYRKIQKFYESVAIQSDKCRDNAYHNLDV